MIGNSLVIFLLIPLAIFAWAAMELVQCFQEARSLRSGIGRLIEKPSAPDSFLGTTPLQKRAAATVRKVQHAKLVLQIQPEREVAGITAEFSARLGRTRALAGLLIILGLLITLANLRSAVERMKAALEPPRTAVQSVIPPEESDNLSTVRNGIAGIASAAGTAFGYSGFTIALAGLVLLASVVAQREASSAIRGFASWLFDRHDELLMKQAEQPQDAPGRLAYAADVLVQVAATFRETNTALADLKLFGNKLESAAQEIGAAMADLPTRLDTSMAKISNDVAVGIRDGLEHQAQYLNSLVTIYSDHAIVVQKTIEFISRITDANKSASEALVHLRSLPEQIQVVAMSSEAARAASQQLATTVRSLDDKVAALPAGDLAMAATELADAAGRLGRLESSVAEMLEATKSLFQSAIDDATRRSSEAVVKQLASVSSVIQSLKTDLTTDTTRQLTELKTTLSKLREAVDTLRAGTDPGMESLHAQLNQLIQNVGSLPSMQLMRIFGSNRAHTEKS